MKQYDATDLYRTGWIRKKTQQFLKFGYFLLMKSSLVDDLGAVFGDSVRRAFIGDTIFPDWLYVTSTAILSFILLFV
jgi:hypothetical protein